MGSIKKYFLCIIYLFIIFTEGDTKRKVENKIKLLNNYIPATMHIILYVTDVMRYELGTSSSSMSTTTQRPTPAHKPGYYAPPLSSHADRINSSKELPTDEKRDYLGEISLQHPTFQNVAPVMADSGSQKEESFSYGRTGSKEEPELEYMNIPLSLNTREHILYSRARNTPPTKAYVTLLSLYDLLKKEARDLGLHQYNGYGEKIIKELAQTSNGSASDQMTFIFSKLVDRMDTKNVKIINKVKVLLVDLKNNESYLSTSLKFIHPFQFVL